ncbi:MAG: isoprenylcysteine carboxylmethyltransferase family protein [Bacilli bacterium]|nr:isoprenylcysteine carboxylmethyltransferase family protein [Bacilli bacterium]
MTFKLFIQGLIKFIIGIILVGLLIFIPAGSINFTKGWLFMGLLFIPMFIVGIILMIFNPKLLERRLNAKEKENDQKIVLLLSGIVFILGFIICGLNYRFNWFRMPYRLTYIFSIMFLIFYFLYCEILRENPFLNRTIEVRKDDKVIDTGFYAVVRHPMYSITLMLFLLIPLVLGSIHAFFIFLLFPIIFIKRIINEEKVLEKDLKGYIEYKKKVKYRLIPFVW